MNELCALIDRHCPGHLTPTAIPRLTLSRSNAATDLAPAIYTPLFCVIAQGRKRIFLGGESFNYDPTSYLVTSADLPVTGQVLEGPALGLMLALDAAIIADLLLQMKAASTGKTPLKALAVSSLEGDLLDPVLRLLRLLDQPRDIPLLAPLIEREILYRLLLGPRGEMLRQLALPSSDLSRISRAINVIRSQYHEPLRVEELAQLAGMSAPSFHRHFRAITAMSPLQFQKKIRLQEARRLLLTRHADAASIGFDVGYESPSQFSREYRRMFGAPPGRDTSRVRRLHAL
jgi:AraC-like DNA-binding protein